MSGGVHGGRYGVVNAIAAVRNWQVNDNRALAAFANSGTAIGHGRKGGVGSWSGQYQNHGATPPVMPGTLFGFVGYTAPDSDVLGTTGMKYSGNAMVDSVTINWDWASGNVLETATTFQGDLGLSAVAGSSVVPTDALVSDPEPVSPCHIDYSTDGTTWTPLANLTQAQLQLTNSVQGYVNSSTAGLTGRKAGLFDWNLSISIEDSLLGGGVTKGTDYQWRLYTTASLFYQLKWGTVQEFTNLQVNIETGAIISHTIAVQMNAEVAAVLGHVLAPSTTAIWGT